MSKEATFEKVREIVAEQLSVDAAEVKEESNFQNDLGADSLDTVELVMAPRPVITTRRDDSTIAELDRDDGAAGDGVLRRPFQGCR